MRKFFFLFLLSSLSNAGTVAIVGDSEGKGYAWLAGNTCYVVTPKHVVRFIDEPRLISSDGVSALSSHVSNLGIEGDDIALLKSRNLEICRNEKLELNISLNTALEQYDTGVLLFSDENSSVSRMRVFVTGYDSRDILVEPQSENYEIIQGMSGSTLKLNNAMSGMLVSVRDGVGRVYRQDYIASLISHIIGSAEADEEYERLKLINNSDISYLYQTWKTASQNYPLHPGIAEELALWKQRYESEKNSCEIKIDCEEQNMRSVNDCVATVVDLDTDESRKMSSISGCLELTKRNAQCFDVATTKELPEARRRCEFVYEDLPPIENAIAYRDIALYEGDTTWDNLGSNRFRANYQFVYGNKNISETIKCRFRVQGVTKNRSTGVVGRVHKTNRHNFTLDPEEEKIISGSVVIKLTQAQQMPSTRLFRTCNYQ